MQVVVLLISLIHAKLISVLKHYFNNSFIVPQMLNLEKLHPHTCVVSFISLQNATISLVSVLNFAVSSAVMTDTLLIPAHRFFSWANSDSKWDICGKANFC